MKSKIGSKTFRVLAYCVLMLTAIIAAVGALKQKKTPLSNLSPGDFERQLEVPESSNLEPNSDLMKKALEDFKHLPYDIGERIKFVITFKRVKAGTAEVLVRSPIKWEGSPGWAQRFTGEVVGASWYSWLVQIHDSIEGIVGPTFAVPPLRFYINQQESNFRQSKIVQFDLASKKIRQVTKKKDTEEKRQEFPFSDGVKDALGAFYYFRALNKPGEGKTEFQFPIFTSEKTWTAVAKWDRQEKLKVSGNDYDTDVYKLETQLGGILQQTGKISLWLTRDSRRLPVYIEAEVKFGYIRVELLEWDQGFADPKVKTVYPPIRPK